MNVRLALIPTLLLLTCTNVLHSQQSFKTISGYVRTSGGVGISGVTMNGLPAPPTTDSLGYYSVLVPVYVTGSGIFGWSGTVTPTKTGYSFVPDSMVYTNVTSNTVTNYTGSLQTFTIYGYVRTSGRVAISDVVMNGLPGNPSTDAKGYYAATVTYGWNGTATPTKAGCSFVPASTLYKYVTADQRDDYAGTIQTFAVSGYVQTRSGGGVSGVTMNGLSGNPTTDDKGYYFSIVDYGWGGTVTPTKTGYNFSPMSSSYKSVTLDQRTDYVASVQVFVISGYVLTAAGAGIADVVMNGLPGNPSTDGTGFYLVGVDYGWSGTATPAKAGYSFTQTSTAYANVTSNQNTNYVGTLLSYTISGYVKTAAGVPITGVVLNGLPGSPTTYTDGFYVSTVTYGWSGTAKPTVGGMSFIPSSISYTNVTSNLSNQNYTGSAQSSTISGFVKSSIGVAMSGVAMIGLPSTTSTDANGFYSCVVSNGWSGTVVPVKTGLVFSPPSMSYSNVISPQSDQNFTAYLQTLTISGYVRTSAGAGIAGVAINGLMAATTTDSTGYYASSVGYAWAGTVTPSKAGYSFNPPARTYPSLTSDQSNQNYTGSLGAYTVSGFVRTAAGAAISGVVIGGLPTTTTTDISGYYSCVVSNGWSGTLMPSNPGYSFSPVSRTYSNVTSDQPNQDFTGTLAAYTVSGFVKTAAGAAISTVVIAGLPAATTTDTTGHYSCIVSDGWSGTVTPSKAGYSFSPVSRTYSNVTSDQPNENFTGTLGTYAISGFVRTPAGVAISGVVMSGLPAATTTDTTGYYSCIVSYGWSGTVTPSKAVYSFSPVSRTYSNVTSDQPNQNFTGTIAAYTLSGFVKTAAGAAISAVVIGGLPVATATDTTGYYSCMVSYGWSGTVTPSKAGYSFSPVSRTYSNVTSDQPNQNFTGTLGTYAISGFVKTPAGVAISGVVMSGLPAATTTDTTGYYSCIVSYGWSGTVTPSKGGYSFSPSYILYSNVSIAQSNQNYTASGQTFVVSGYVKTVAGAPISNVSMVGFPTTTKTDASGYYFCVVNYGWSGTVMPVLIGYIFSPTSISYVSIVADRIHQDYSGAAQQYKLSGYVKTGAGTAISNVAMAGLPIATTTDTGGYYSCAVGQGWSGTVTPTKAGFTFSPPAIFYGSVLADLVNQNYAATSLQTYTVSGYVRTTTGAGISGVVLIGLPTNPTTNASGFYTSIVGLGWSGIVTPTKAGYIFSPPSTNYASVSSNAASDYTGTSITAVEEISGPIPTHYRLLQNYPNPFNPTTTIQFALPTTVEISLKIFNTLGKEICLLADGRAQAGNYQVQWDASAVPSGVYFCRLCAGEFTVTKRLLLIK